MDKLQWGNRKRSRCVKVKTPVKSEDGSAVEKKFTPQVDQGVGCNDEVRHFPSRLIKSTNGVINRDVEINNNDRERGRRSSIATLNEGQKALLSSSSSRSPENEEDFYRYYITRVSVGLDVSNKSKVLMPEDNSNIRYNNNNNNSPLSNKGVWPRLFIALSNKEKEEDFMAMKGCKPPQRPKKRAKLIQKSLLVVSPGAWLSDLCQERYEVREKKTSKKKPRGLKGMGSMESDSE